MQAQEDSLDLTETAQPPRRSRRRVTNSIGSRSAECIDLSLEDEGNGIPFGSGMLKESICAGSFGTTDPQGGARQCKRQWSDMAGIGGSDMLFSSGFLPGHDSLGRGCDSSGGSPGSGGDNRPLQWGATGRRQRRQRAPAHAAITIDDEPEVVIVDTVPVRAAAAARVQQPAPGPAAQATQRRGQAPPSTALARQRQEEEDARLALQCMQEEEARRRRAEDFARARMRMWHDLEERPYQQPQQQQRQQQQHRYTRPGQRGHHHHGSSGFMPSFGPPSYMPPMQGHRGFPGAVGPQLGSGGSRRGRSPMHGGLPASLMALREAMVGLQRAGLPPHLLFSDRDFTADDYEMLCRLDDMVENKKGASTTQLAALPTQTVHASSLLGEGGERLSCSVCLEEFGEGQQLCTLPCLHKFHADCIQTWLKQKATCPVCQQKL